MGNPFFAYMIRCKDGSYYVGHTDNLVLRVNQHNWGEGGQYTKTRRPVTLVWSQEFFTREEAKSVERQLKGWNRAKKEALIEGRYDLISKLAGRGAEAHALRDALLRPSPSSGLRKAPQERGSRGQRK